MALEGIVPRLPKDSKAIENVYRSCERQRRFIGVNAEEFSSHREKAKSDLSRVNVDLDGQSWDWAIIKSYYSIHHAINALLVKAKGFYSKDHICAIIALKQFELIPEDLYVKLREIDAKFSDFTGLEITYSMRKISQYDVQQWKLLTRKDAKSVYELAKRLVAFAEERCYA